jgi:pimeloyl-ACP methyl ester carboxylesterase
MNVYSSRAGLGFCLGAIALWTWTPVQAEAPKTPTFGEALILAPAGRGQRVPFPIDPFAAQVASGAWQPPAAGDKLSGANGRSRSWQKLSPAKDGSYQHRALTGGYAYFSVVSPDDRVMVLEASGHGMVWVNGEPRAGDPYSYGYVHVPVELKKGANQFLFHVARGRLKAKLTAPPAALFFNLGDTTLPDLIAGKTCNDWAAVPLVNATTSWQTNLALLSGSGGVATQIPLESLPPLSVSKVRFVLNLLPPEAGTITAKLELLRVNEHGEPLAEAEISLRVQKPEQTYKRTFRSAIDDSVQYYAVVPATPGKGRPGLALTLHGAGVEGLGQAACFTPKSWTHVVAATNRRPYGFDWEDWGRLDALEVLEDASKALQVDPQRVWLTGHSMGGHGTWHLGVTYPDKFAAIGPSAGWISMMSYAGVERAEHPDQIADLFQRAASAGDTLALVKNLSSLGVYVLHGNEDDNVPVEQAREMRKVLGGFHSDWAYHEQPGAGHWWGNPCVDWPEMFEFFAGRSRPNPKDVRHVEFATASPGISAQCQWAAIAAQQKAFKRSSIQMTHDPKKRTFEGKTENVALLGLDVGHLSAGQPLQVTLDGQHLADLHWPASGNKLWLSREGDKWKDVGHPPVGGKSPARCGPFRDAFRNHVVLVIGTKGSAEENAWALRKARFDAETFWYRGNGYLRIVPDSDFKPDAERDHNVVLYGNADTNAAWSALLGQSPVQVKSGSIQFGEREVKGSDLACLFVRPRPGSEIALVGVVGGSGVKGMRLTDRLPFFVSGVGYPDCVLLGPETLTKGLAGVNAAGFFGNDWSVERGEFVWR